MNFSSLLGIFFSREQSVTNNEEKQTIAQLTNEDDKILYHQIVKDLLHCYEERIEHPSLPSSSPLKGPQEYVLTFRESRSWKVVETLLIDLNSVDAKINNWVSIWLNRITQFRTWQSRIHSKATQLQKFQNTLEDCQKLLSHFSLENHLNKDMSAILAVRNKISRLMQMSQDIKQSVQNDRVVMTNALARMQSELHSLANANSRISRDISCQKVIQYLKDNWQHLTVFAEWPEVLVDVEKISVRVRRFQETVKDKHENSLKNSLDASTKAIFLIEEKSQEEEPLEYKGETPGKIIRPTMINLKESHLAPKSPSPQKLSSSIRLTDEYIFDYPMADSEEGAKKEKSVKARNLERVVKLALKTVNRELAKRKNSIKLFESEGDIKNNQITPPYKFNRRVVSISDHFSST